MQLSVIWRHLLILILSLGASVSALASTSTEVRDIIFDLDWTLIAPINQTQIQTDKTNIIYADGEFYRLNPYALPVLHFLIKNTRYRISFFSGGNSQRNLEVARTLIHALRDKNTYFIPYKILNKEDMVILSTSKELSFAERNKKDLKVAGFNPETSVLVDDIKNFTPDSQLDRLLWLGSTFEDSTTFKASEIGKPYQASSYQEWSNERLKLVIALDRILKNQISEKYDPIKTRSSNIDLQPLINKIAQPSQFRLAPLCRLIFN